MSSSVSVFNEANFISQLSIIINTSVLWLTWLSNRVSGLTFWRSLSFWCRHQGQAWRRGSSVSFLIFMSHQSTSLNIFKKASFIFLTNTTIPHHQQSSFTTNMTIRHSFSTKIEIFEVQSFCNPGDAGQVCRFWSWCHIKAALWSSSMRRASSLSLSHSRNYPSSSTEQFSD